MRQRQWLKLGGLHTLGFPTSRDEGSGGTIPNVRSRRSIGLVRPFLTRHTLDCHVWALLISFPFAGVVVAPPWVASPCDGPRITW